MNLYSLYKHRGDCNGARQLYRMKLLLIVDVDELLCLFVADASILTSQPHLCLWLVTCILHSRRYLDGRCQSIQKVK